LKRILCATTALAAVLCAGTSLPERALAQTAGPKAPFTAFLDGDAQTYFGVQSGSTNNGGTNGLSATLAPKADSHGRALGAV
jgi:hypothetical protein